MAATSGGKFEGWKYDAKKGEVWRYSYDLSNRLVKAEYSAAGTGGLKEKAAYKYDWRNLMVSRTLGGVTEYFEYDDDGRLIYTEKGNTKTDFIWYGNILWAERRTDASGEKVYYHHTDHLGTTECITDINKKVVWTAEYESFGKVISESGSADFVPSFTGKQLDEATGLYYFNARWYDCEIGRFMAQDPARDGGNWYAYCNNSPLSNVDLNGLIADSIWDGISLGTGIASLVVDIKAGNTNAAIIDGLGIVADGIALALPFVPGGASTAIKAARATAAVADIAAGAMSVADGVESGCGLEIASGALQIVGGVSSATGLVSRCSKEAKAKNFYLDSGFDSNAAKEHMRGIDFNKDVKVSTLKEGTSLDQWQDIGCKQGSYYTNPGASPNKLGIEVNGRVKNEYIVNTDTQVLQSTAADTSRIKGIDSHYQGKGGGTQYFSAKKENFSVIK